MNRLMLSSLVLLIGVGTTKGQEPVPGGQVDRVFSFEVDGRKEELKYDLFVPADYDGKKEFPLMLFLHGAGERGDDLAKVRVWGPPRLVKSRKDFPFIVISPQCPKNSWWTKQLTGLTRLVDHVAGELKVNKQKMYCTGLSMGGYGTWALCAKHPRLFAAAAPICGGGDVELAEKLTDLPIWAFHGGADRVVPVDGSKKIVARIKELGGKKAKLTIYEGVGHNSWSKAYATEELYKWMLSHSRSDNSDNPE